MSLTSTSSDSEQVSLEVSYCFFLYYLCFLIHFDEENLFIDTIKILINFFYLIQDFLESCRATTLLAELTDDEMPDPDDEENDDENDDDDDDDYEEEEECYEVSD